MVRLISEFTPSTLAGLTFVVQTIKPLLQELNFFPDIGIGKNSLEYYRAKICEFYALAEYIAEFQSELDEYVFQGSSSLGSIAVDCLR